MLYKIVNDMTMYRLFHVLFCFVLCVLVTEKHDYYIIICYNMFMYFNIYDMLLWPK